jgi:ribonuclease HI
MFDDRATCVSDRLEHWERVLWGQLATSGLQRLWSQAIARAIGKDPLDSRGDFYAVVHNWTNRLRGNITAAYETSDSTTALDVGILKAFYKGLAIRTEIPPSASGTGTAYLLFFDGGSRGNPGPGGSGAVIVRLGEEPELVWAGSMSYARDTTTNNFAEYQGLCTGLCAAETNGWTPLAVVGDSMMIIRQMTTRHKPKAPKLRPLYEKARSTADALRVRSWSHHYRSHNKMADKAANQAMDSGTSYQAHADDRRQDLDHLRVWIDNDVTHWLQQRV